MDSDVARRDCAPCSLFVVVVSVGCENENENSGFVDFVHQAMFLCDAATPLATMIPSQLFGFASARARMVHEFVQ